MTKNFGKPEKLKTTIKQNTKLIIMDIKSLIQFAEQDAIQKGINLKSPLTKDFVQFWTDHEVKEALKKGDYGYAFRLSKFNEWVQQY